MTAIVPAAIGDETIGVVSIKEACTIAGVSRRTIYNWLEAGKLEYVRTAGGGVRIVAASLFRKGEGQTPVLTGWTGRTGRDGASESQCR